MNPQNSRPYVAILLLALILYGGLRIMSNINSRDNPPAACQILGGTWGIWSGWRC